MAKTTSPKWGLVTSSVAALAALATPSFAQTEGPEVDEIVVTAQRFEQTIRDVPISMAALDGQALDDLGINDLKEINGQVPNLFINNFNGRSDTVRLFIRGIGQNDVSLTQDPSVALYIDNVYVGSSIGGSFDLLDLERIEILRGPQGTLYGRNATGGAVNLISRAPELGEFSVRGRATIGNYNLRAGQVGLNIPLGDTLAAKIDFGRTERDGWISNSGPGEDFSVQDRENARFALRFEPGDNITADYAYDWSNVQDTQPFTSLTSLAPGLLGSNVYALGAPTSGGPGITVFGTALRVTYTDPAPYSASRPDTVTSARAVLPGDTTVSGHSLNLEWDVTPNFTLRSITGYRQIDAQARIDYLPTATGALGTFIINATAFPVITTSFTPFPIPAGSLGGQNIKTDFENFSQEFQALGETPFLGGNLRYVAGLYYYTQEGSQVQAGVFVTPRGGASAVIDDRSWAAFSELTFTPSAFDERLHFTLGGRYSEDDRSAVRINESSFGYAALGGFTVANCADPTLGPTIVAIVGAGACVAPTGVIQGANYDQQFDNFSMSGSATFEVTEDINLYARIAQGYKTGGTSERSADPNLFRAGYQPEDILSYEIGLKGLYFGNRLSLNMALFHMEIEAFQTSVQTGATPGDRDFVGLDGNVFEGFEADATLAVTDKLTLTASLGLLDTEVGQPTVTFPTVVPPFTRTDTLIPTFPYAPERTVNFGANYQTPLGGDYSLSASFNYAYQDGSPTSLNVFDNTTLDQHGVLDAQVTLHRANTSLLGNASLKLWGRNLTDEDYRVVDNSAFAFVGAAAQAEWGEPSTFGVTVSFER